MPNKEKETKQSAAAKPIKLDLPAFGESESLTGEVVRIPRLEVPLIRVSYKSEDDEAYVCPRGEFIEYNIADKTTVPLGKKIVVQILHHRQSLSAFKQLAGGSTESYYTPEISMNAKSAPLFMAKSGADGKRQQTFMGEGTIDKNGLRKDFPELRYQRSLYVLHEGKLKNLVVYGASFSGFIDFTKAIQGQSSASHTIELTTKKEKNGTVIYYPIVFTPKDKVDMKALEPTLRQLKEWFEEYDKRVAAQAVERAEQAAIDRGDGAADSAKPDEAPAAPAARARTIAEEVQGKDDDEERADTLRKADEMFGTGPGGQQEHDD